MAIKIKDNNEYKNIHELYKNNNGTVQYIGELYKNNNGSYEHIFSAGYDTTLTTNPATTGIARAKPISYKIDGQSVQKGVLPDGYTQVEYLENSATGPYFQTTIQPITEKTAVEIKGYISNGNSAFGGDGNSVPYFNSTSNTATTLAFRYGSTAAAKIITDTNGKFYNTPATIKFGNNKMYLDGELKKTLSEEPFTYDYPMRIWARRAGSVDAAIGRLYFANIYNEDTLVFSGVPCKRNSDNVLGLYDTVSNSFLEPTISGSGTFTAGPALPIPTSPLEVKGVGNSGLPSGYKKLEYIESSGTQWIDTGKSFSSSTDTLKVVYENVGGTTSFKWAFGCYGGSSIGITTGSGTTTNNLYYSNTRTIYSSYFTGQHTFLADSNGVSMDGTNVASYVSFSVLGNVYLFATNNSGTSSNFGGYKIYSYKQTRNGVNLINLIPAERLSDNAIGMYDTVSNTFFGNAGTGTFIAGPEDTSCVVPVLQANNCGSYTFTGNETAQILLHNWRPTDTTYAIGFRYSLFGDGINYSDMSGIGPAYCNSDDLPLSTYSNLYNSLVSPAYCYYTGTNNTYSLFVRLPKTIANSDADVLNWLKGKTFYYQRATDTTWTEPTISNINLPAPLQKISTYKDSIESDGTLTREVGVVVFDGTENWIYDSTYSRFASPAIPNCIVSDKNRTINGFCTHYKVLHNEEPISQIVIGDSYFGAITSNFLAHDSHTSVDDFKSWLAEQYAAGTPVTVYYPLETATDTTIEVPTINTSAGTNIIQTQTDIAPSAVSWTYRKKHK